MQGIDSLLAEASAKARDAESAEVAFEAAIKSATVCYLANLASRIGDASIIRKWTMKREGICKMPWGAWLERQQYLFVNSIRGFDCFLDLSAQSYRVLFFFFNIFTSLIRQC
jgi:hypothetical protein